MSDLQSLHRLAITIGRYTPAVAAYLAHRNECNTCGGTEICDEAVSHLKLFKLSLDLAQTKRAARKASFDRRYPR